MAIMFLQMIGNGYIVVPQMLRATWIGTEVHLTYYTTSYYANMLTVYSIPNGRQGQGTRHCCGYIKSSDISALHYYTSDLHTKMIAIRMPYFSNTGRNHLYLCDFVDVPWSSWYLTVAIHIGTRQYI